MASVKEKMKSISKDKSKDAGMALALILLLIGHFRGDKIYFSIAILILIVDMTCPIVFKPFAFFWFTLSELLATVVSKVILGGLFFLVVTPIGFLRKLLGEKILHLNFGDRSGSSVFTVRDHLYNPRDLENIY